MSPVVKQGLFQLLYSTFLHNSEALALLVGVGLTLVLLFLKPKRNYLLFFVGFLFLLLRFEYLKHVADPLAQQTIGVVVTQQGFQRTRRLIDIFINDLIPLLMYFIGWGSLFLGILFSRGLNRKITK